MQTLIVETDSIGKAKASIAALQNDEKFKSGNCQKKKQGYRQVFIMVIKQKDITAAMLVHSPTPVAYSYK